MKKLLLHACCGPCSLEPLRLLRVHGFEPTLLWYNPNIAPASERQHRLEVLLAWAQDVAHVDVIVADESTADVEAWEQDVAYHGENRGTRCAACYSMRVNELIKAAQRYGFNYVSTTLAVSPYQLLADCACSLSRACEDTGIIPIMEDFRPYYKKATLDARELGMYRQDYCGCRFSVREAQASRELDRARRHRLTQASGKNLSDISPEIVLQSQLFELKCKLGDYSELMHTDDFNYDLPEELIAQEPAAIRDRCKMLVLHRESGEIEHKIFADIIDYLEPGDLLVANKTRVMPARLVGHKRETGGVAETLLLRRREDKDALGHVWECLVNPGKRLKPGAVIEFRPGGLHAPESAPVVLTGTVEDFVDDSRGGRLVRFDPTEGYSLDEAIHAAGHVPLPPYITDYEGDPEKYQTVYAMEEEHSAAAPTAGLHFTPELIERIREKGIGWAEVELEVGIDTFRLVEEDNPEDHIMHTERYHVSQDVIDAIHATKAAGHRVIAVGTTSVRSLESAFSATVPVYNPACVARYFEDAPDSAAVLHEGDIVAQHDALTNLFLMPGSTFHVVDAMITNFHVPRSTLMMLVSAFASRDQIMAAYKDAIEHRYAMLSFGDAMFIE